MSQRVVEAAKWSLPSPSGALLATPSALSAFSPSARTSFAFSSECTLALSWTLNGTSLSAPTLRRNGVLNHNVLALAFVFSVRTHGGLWPFRAWMTQSQVKV